MFLMMPLLIICGLVSSPAQDAAPSSPERSLAGLGRFEKTLGGEGEIRTRVEAFFKGIENGKTEDAFGTLMKGSPLGENTESVDKLVAETRDIVKTYGEIKEYFADTPWEKAFLEKMEKHSLNDEDSPFQLDEEDDDGGGLP